MSQQPEHLSTQWRSGMREMFPLSHQGRSNKHLGATECKAALTWQLSSSCFFKYKSNPRSPLKDPMMQHTQENRSARLWKHACTRICKAPYHLYQERHLGKWRPLIRHMTISIMRVIIVCPLCCFMFPAGCLSVYFYFPSYPKFQNCLQFSLYIMYPQRYNSLCFTCF